MTYATMTRTANGQISIDRPLDIPVYQGAHKVGHVTRKRICDCNSGIQELWVGHDQDQMIFLAGGASFEKRDEAIDYLLDCWLHEHGLPRLDNGRFAALANDNHLPF